MNAPGFSPAEQQVTIGSAGGGVLHVQLELPVARQSVEVTATLGTVTPDSVTSATLVGRDDIARTPGADRPNSMAIVTGYVPGAYVIHDQLHLRGGHQATWAVDGVPVPNTDIASNVGPPFDPKDIDYLEVQRGGFSTEYGDRAYGVFNVSPRTGFERNNEAGVVLSYGGFHQTYDQLNFGSHTTRFAYYGSLNGSRSDFGLQTPGPPILHDRVSGFGAFGSVVYNPSGADQLRLVASARQDHYQVPNDEEQQQAGVRDVQREADAFTNFSWLHTIRSGMLVSVSPFYHFNRADYVGAGGERIVPRDDRSSHYGGAQVMLAGDSRRHSYRSGAYGFGERDHRRLGVSGEGSTLSQRVSPSAWLAALFLEDKYKPASWLAISGGVRLTRFGGGVNENAASPRVGASITLPGVHFALRGFYGRFYQAPPLSTVSGPLLEFAAARGFGFLPLHGERDEEYEYGLNAPIGGWNLDFSVFRTQARNFFDHDALGNSNIFFPLTIARARIRGQEVSLGSPALFGRARIHLAYSHQHAEGEGAISGGLTDFAAPEARFLLDHDQRHTLSLVTRVALPARAWLAATWTYGSGFADENGPAHLPGHTTADVALGKDFRENWSVSVSAMNAGNRRFLLDRSPTFGGTHYADPRQVYVQVRYRFRY